MMVLQNVPPQPTPPVNLGSFHEKLDAFSKIVVKWLGQSTRLINRVALGVVLVQPVSDRPSGYRRLSKYLRAVEIDAEKTQDFGYRINRSRTETFSDEQIVINRICTWGLGFPMATSLELRGPAATAKTTTFGWLVRVDMDINTWAEFEGTFHPSRAIEIFECLRKYAIEIGQKGDVA
jgi:hypothetical protein